MSGQMTKITIICTVAVNMKETKIFDSLNYSRSFFINEC
jgi:hypothetical protein